MIHSALRAQLSLFLSACCLFLAPAHSTLLAEETTPATSAPSKRLKIMTYNIHHGRGMDEKIDLHRIADVIRKEKPDLVALQEVDESTRRSGNVKQTEELGKLTGMKAHFFRQIDFEGGEYGQAVLSKYPISEPQIHWLPGEPERERRIAATAIISIDGKPLRFGSTHLHHANEQFRLAQSQTLTKLFSDTDSIPTIIAGDYNANPDSMPIQQMGEHWFSVTPLFSQNSPSPHPFATFPSKAAAKQIDYILGAPKSKFQVIESYVIEEQMASDHRPLVSIINLHE